MPSLSEIDETLHCDCVNLFYLFRGYPLYYYFDIDVISMYTYVRKTYKHIQQYNEGIHIKYYEIYCFYHVYTLYTRVMARHASIANYRVFVINEYDELNSHYLHLFSMCVSLPL